MEIILFILGFILVVKGAGYFIDGSSALAKKLGVSTLVIGLTVVAFGTTMPELAVSIMATSRGAGDIAIGNIVGSNISNILLILGISAVISSLLIKRSTIWKEIPFALLAVIVLLLFTNLSLIRTGENYLSRIEGIILILFFVFFLYYVFKMAKESRLKIRRDIIEIKKYLPLSIFFMIAGGLIALYLGGQWVVGGAIYIARRFGLSELLISSTIIAIGTSLPELVIVTTAALKKNADLAIGNIIGSNIFNIFWILGISSIIRPILVPATVVTDMIFLALITMLLFLFMFIGKKHELKRWQGMVFIVLYAIYVTSLIFRG